MNYWKIKNNNNINSFEKLNSFKERISIKNYEHIYSMIEWDSMDYEEKFEYLKYYLFFNLNTNNINKQEKSKIILFTKEYPYIVDWILQNWNNITKDLGLNCNHQELFIFLTKVIKTINYNFSFKNLSKKLSDQWNIIDLSNNEILKFINESKRINGYISIYYLFNKELTLEGISKNWGLGVTRERVRQINVKQIRENRVFFGKIYEFVKNKIILIEEVNIAAIRVIEKILYPKLKDAESILNLDNQLLLDLQKKLENSSLLDFNNEELKLLIKNNYVIFYKNKLYKVEESLRNKKLNFKEMLIIFLKLKYKNTQILNKEELRKEFYDFLLENHKLNKNYNVNNSRSFDTLISRVKELLYYDNEKLVVIFDESKINSEIANKILNEFIKLEKQQVIMVSTRKFLKLFNILTNYKFLNANPDFVHNYLKKYSTINNKEKYFSRTPILINSIDNSNTINLFYKQVNFLFNNKTINWELFLDVLENECGLGKILIQNYVSIGNKYFYKNNNTITVL